MRPAIPLELDIDTYPQFNHPLVQAFVGEDVEVTQMHIECLYEAIEYARRMLYGG